MRTRFPLLALLLAGACTTTPKNDVAAQTNRAPGEVAVAAEAAAPTPEAEDVRLLAFLDKAFDESVASSPQTLTSLGVKKDYGRLDDYTEAAADRQLALAERQLADMQAQFDPARLSAAGRLSYHLFKNGSRRAARTSAGAATASPCLPMAARQARSRSSSSTSTGSRASRTQRPMSPACAIRNV
jgi:uncharacterized protein (DUF885 family)